MVARQVGAPACYGQHGHGLLIGRRVGAVPAAGVGERHLVGAIGEQVNARGQGMRAVAAARVARSGAGGWRRLGRARRPPCAQRRSMRATAECAWIDSKFSTSTV